jgi:hypothetical protein
VSAATPIASAPLARVPDAWPLPVVAGTATVALAVLNFAAAMAAA